GQEWQPFPAPRAPPAEMALQAPWAPWAIPSGMSRGMSMLSWCPRRLPSAPRPAHLPLTHASLKMTSTDLPPSATFMIHHGIVSPPGTALQGPQGCGLPLALADQWGPQGQPQIFLVYYCQGRAAVPAPPVLPLSLPGYHHLMGQYTQHSLSSTANPLGAPLGSGSLPSNDIPMDDGTSPGSDTSLGSDVTMEEGTLLGSEISLHSDSPPTGSIMLSEEVLLEEAIRNLDCSLGAVGINQDGPSSIPMPRDPTIPHHKISLLWLAKKILSTDYSIPKTSKAILSMEQSWAVTPVPFLRGNRPLAGKPGQMGPCRTHGH
uniref:Uncharacterized protein n=1 Tax=Strix occidentalis caurina TaxID=311401 RepID=A0A8D0EN78_STROC